MRRTLLTGAAVLAALVVAAPVALAQDTIAFAPDYEVREIGPADRYALFQDGELVARTSGNTDNGTPLAGANYRNPGDGWTAPFVVAEVSRRGDPIGVVTPGTGTSVRDFNQGLVVEATDGKVALGGGIRVVEVAQGDGRPRVEFRDVDGTLLGRTSGSSTGALVGGTRVDVPAAGGLVPFAVVERNPGQFLLLTPANQGNIPGVNIVLEY